MKKDAGRQRWSPYLRQLKKNGDPDNSLSADERSDDGLTDYHGRFQSSKINEPRYVISNNVAVCQVYTVQPLLSVETPNGVQLVA